jgi:hypothetical protein
VTPPVERVGIYPEDELEGRLNDIGERDAFVGMTDGRKAR